MCTVSFLPNAKGFYLAVNRDEKLTRCRGLAPAIVNFRPRRAMFPREPNGGTWISANDAGTCLALINWHRVESEPAHHAVSRGEVVRELAGKSSMREIAEALAGLPLNRLRPFRLIAIIPSKKTVMEWRWNLQQLSTHKHAWKSRHWFSSGFNECRAERVRAGVCASFVTGGDDFGSRETSPRRKRAGVNAAGYSLSTLRRLHRSHLPERGPFSICMHRSDAATVSYTEIAVSGRRAAMRYKPGPTCSNGAMVVKTISIARGL